MLIEFIFSILVYLITSAYFVRRSKKTFDKFVFIICSIFANLLFYLLVKAKIHDQILVFFSLSYFLLVSSILFGWIYFTFTKGLTAQIIEIINNNGQIEIEKEFLDGKGNNIILSERINYLTELKYITKLENYYQLSNKSILIANIHKIICYFFRLGSGGGLK